MRISNCIMVWPGPTLTVPAPAELYSLSPTSPTQPFFSLSRNALNHRLRHGPKKQLLGILSTCGEPFERHISTCQVIFARPRSRFLFARLSAQGNELNPWRNSFITCSHSDNLIAKQRILGRRSSPPCPESKERLLIVSYVDESITLCNFSSHSGVCKKAGTKWDAGVSVQSDPMQG